MASRMLIPRHASRMLIRFFQALGLDRFFRSGLNRQASFLPRLDSTDKIDDVLDSRSFGNACRNHRTTAGSTLEQVRFFRIELIGLPGRLAGRVMVRQISD